MKILHLTPGTGSFHCGSCLRDNALIKALRLRGHDALMVPLYLPLVTDADEANPEQEVRVGGVSLYLQQKFPRFYRFVPGFIHELLDSEKCLRWASQFIGMTSPRDLGEMTVGSLLGEKGQQWVEWEKLVDWIVQEAKPEVISLSNSLLCGLAPALSRRLNVPILCSLQGEDSFLDTLPEPYLSEAWSLMRQNAHSITCFIAPSQFYADEMLKRLDVTEKQMAVVPNGLTFENYESQRIAPTVPTIGYLARMIHGKGLTTLVDAFLQLAARNTVSEVRLRIAGAKTSADKTYLSGLEQKIHQAGLAHRVTFEPNLSFEDKVKFLHEISVFSVPATYGEAFGLYVVEAQACGVPVVEPRHGAFPEILATTQGGLLCEPDDVTSLANALELILLDHSKAHELSVNASLHTRSNYSAQKMAELFEKHLAAHLS